MFWLLLYTYSGLQKAVQAAYCGFTLFLLNLFCYLA